MDANNYGMIKYPAGEMLRYLNENVMYLTMPEPVK